MMIESPGGGDGRFYGAGGLGGWVGFLNLHLSMGKSVKIFNANGLVKNIWAPGNERELSFMEGVPAGTRGIKKQNHGRQAARRIAEPASWYNGFHFQLITNVRDFYSVKRRKLIRSGIMSFCFFFF